MPTIGFSFGKDIHESAPLEDFLLFFQATHDLHKNGIKQSLFSRHEGKGKLPLMSGKLFRGFVRLNEIDRLKEEVKIAKAVFSKLKPAYLGQPKLSEDSRIDLTAKDMSGVFSRIFYGIEHSIEGSIEYNKLGFPDLPVKIIVSDVPSALSMLRMSEEDYNQLDKPPIWTYYQDRIVPR